MTLGSSMRRRRGGGKKKGKKAGVGIRAFYRRTLWALGLGAVGWFGGYGIATQILFPRPERPETFVEVPDLRGATGLEARERVTEAGLVFAAADSIRHPSVSEGLALGQAPLAGQLALPGDTVRITLSRGPERRPVPDVVRLRGDRARTVLEASGFRVLVDSVEASVPRGHVVAMNPAPDSVVALPHEVRVTLSLGPPLVEMPLLLGLAEEDALAELESLELVVPEVETRFRFGLDQGIVIEQEPAAGTPVDRGSAVRLVVGRRSSGG